MFKRFKQFFTKETGQAMVIVAVSFVVLMGVTAFSVDLGMAASTKAKLQAAADAAALAGAQDLPVSATAIQTAKDYAVTNGVDLTDVQIVTPYAGEAKKIEVTISQNFDYIFAKVLGFDSRQIVVRAVAQKDAQWAGEALPFMNLDDTFATNPNIVLWEKTTNPGDDEKLWPIDTTKVDAEYIITNNSGVYSCILTDMLDGFALKSGITRSDEDEVEGLINQFIGQKVYVLSLKNSLINPSLNYNNKQNISVHDVVLLECTLVSYDFKNAVTHGISVHYDGVMYDFYDVITGKVDVPELSGTEANVRLIE
jgi:Flp pilus assembly protein TadG